MISGRGPTATWSRASRICRMAFLVAFIVLLTGFGWCSGQSLSASFLLPTATPTAPPTTLDPVQQNLSLIIGLPTGVGLSIIGIVACVIWLSCSSYIEYRKNRVSASGTHSTLPRTKGTSQPAHNTSNVVSEQGDSVVMSEYPSVEGGGGRGARTGETETRT